MKSSHPSRLWLLAPLFAFSALPWATQAQETSAAYPVAGLTPWQRPTPAPRLTADPPLNRKIALHGVSEPVPASIRFLDNQGGWHTPFTHPGMPGPYDLRGWHASTPSTGQNK